MTIGIDASQANRPQKTGVEWYSFRLIQELKKIVPPNVQVRLYSPTPLDGSLSELPPNWESRVLRWPFHLFWNILRMSLEMRSDPPDLLFVPGDVLPLRLPKAAVVTIHDIGFEVFPDSYSWRGRIIQRWSTRRASHLARKILTVSEFSRDEIVRYYPEAVGRISVVPLAFDPYRFPMQERGEMLSAIGRYRLRTPYFLFVGRLERKKNIDGILEGFRIFHDRHAGQVGARQLALVGPSGQDFIDAWEAISDSPAADFVREVGYVNDADLPLLYAGAEALVFPSRYEGFGLPVLEAFASRIPVITSRSGSLPEVAGEAAEYVNPESPEEIAEALRVLTEDSARREQLIEAGERRLQRFSWRETAEKTWRELAETAERSC